MKEITLQITTRNRLNALKKSLIKNEVFICDPRVHTLICVDGSEDDTHAYIEEHYPQIELISNDTSLGLIASRNRMMSITRTPYAVSLDDDAHFLGAHHVASILSYFSEHPRCAVMAFRIFWGIDDILYLPDDENPMRVKGFVGCGHAWRMAHWKEIRAYPEWFEFYGEEEFAGYELFRKQLEVHYVPQIFVQHRVVVKGRRNDSDFIQRHRRSLRSGWYLMVMFMPLRKIPKPLFYSLFSQFHRFVFKGDMKVLQAIFLALWDVLVHFIKLIRQSNRFTADEYQRYERLPPSRIFWLK